MVFVADDLASWLIGLLADAGRRKLTALILGSDQERALRSAAAAAVRLTAGELRHGDPEQAEQVARVISEGFRAPMSAGALAGQQTMLGALRASVAGQLAVLDEAALTGAGQSPVSVLGVPAAVIAEKLAGHLVREIVSRAARGGPLVPLAAQLNDDVTHLQGQQVHGELRELRGVVLDALARLEAARAAPSPVALAQLPAMAPGFTGRDDELAVLAGLLDPAGAAGTVVVSAVAGLAGVGKTTLAVQAAHAARRRGWYRGGVVFTDLHGYDDQPVQPSQALDALLRDLGVAAVDIPPGAEQRAGLYRSVLAQLVDPVLVIADNVSSEAQVRPLLPGAGQHKVLVTSRHTLAGLGARLVDVTVLDEDAAVVLLDAALRVARPGDERIGGDREAARRLAGACAGLPLALQITAALLNADPTLSPVELAGQLSDERQRLGALRYDDGCDKTRLSVAAAFGLSYRKLDDESARVFRLLPVNPGPDVSVATAAALAGLPTGQVRRVLGGLARAHLVEPAPGTAGRWRMHDLVRLYARQLGEEHADADGREQAVDRLLGYYDNTTVAVLTRLSALPRLAAPEEALTGWDDALAWLDAERASLVAAVGMAAAAGRDLAVMRLSFMLSSYLSLRRRFDDLIASARISLDAARRLGDRPVEAWALRALGKALKEVRQFQEAITALSAAAVVSHEIGDRHDEAAALTDLGAALREARRFEQAITAHRNAAAIFRETGARHGQGVVLCNLGATLAEVGRFDEAITACTDAMDIFRETGDTHGETLALGNLGAALQHAGRFDQAITAHQGELAIFRETGDRHHEATALTNLGAALHQAGRREEAISSYRDAAAIFGETGDRHHQVMALTNLGMALLQVRRFDEVITAFREAAAICRQTGDRHREDFALKILDAAQSALSAGL
jgi:tetratricopeptide (TPR) repeat protein